jgi:hypothetical protein
MVEPATLKFLNERIAELTKQYENRGNRAVLEELSELTTIRDELTKIQHRTADRPEQLSRRLPKEFLSLEALGRQLNGLARQLAEISKDDPHRPDVLNEITTLCLITDSLYESEL